MGTPTDPVVIAGAGPTGLTAAILLALHGVRTLVLERRPQPHALPRAVHLDDEVLRILQQAGVADDFLKISRPALGLRLLDAGHRTMAEFSRSQAVGAHGYPQANMFDQPALENLLRERAAVLPRIELREGFEVIGLTQTPSGCQLSVRDRAGQVSDVGAAAVLGCDGAGSTVRDLIGSRLEDLNFRERWLVVDVRSDRQLLTWDGVHQVCDPERAATYMQVGGDRYRWEFRLRDDERPGDLSAPQILGPLLGPWTGQTDLAGLEIIRTAEYTFRALLAERWQRDRVFLLGDAAHQTPPFIGQGLGAGLRDAANLSWKLAAVLRSQQPEQACALLATYQPERSPHAAAMIRQAVLVGWAMTGGQDAAARVRKLALENVVRVPGVSTHLLDRGTPPLRAGPLVAPHRRPGSLAGHLLPQPMITADGLVARLDDVLGAGFCVLSTGPLTAQLHRLARRLRARVVALRGDVSGDPELIGQTIVDHTGVLGRWLRSGRASAVVVRPDRVVLASTDRSGHLLGRQLRPVVTYLAMISQ